MQGPGTTEARPWGLEGPVTGKGSGKTFKQRAEALGHAIFYLTLYVSGQAGAYALLYFVVFVYVLFSRKIHRQTLPYLERRFPGAGALKRWLYTYRICCSFGQVLVDRAWLGLNERFSLESRFDHRDRLNELLEKGGGAVLLTAHVGNWQVALSGLADLPVPVNALMHYEEESAAKHYFELRGHGCPFNIIRNDGFLGGMVEATAALQRGEVVTIMGDRLVKGPFSQAYFLGDPVRFPVAAFALASAANAPVVILLAAKIGRRNYTVRVFDAFWPKGERGEDRKKSFGPWVERFARALEEYVQEHPFQWYNFYDIWNQ